MNPENIKFLKALIDSAPVSVATVDDSVIYHMPLPDGRRLAICADTTYLDEKSAVIYYTIHIEEDLLEEAVVNTDDKKIDPVAKDIIQIMRMCNTKIMMQEAHLARSKFMTHNSINKKTYS